MRLNVKYKQKLTKTDKQKKKNAEKKKKGPKLLQNYMDNSDCDIDNITLNLTQMKYGTIKCCDVDQLILSDGSIVIKNSWLEVLLIMFSTVINNKPDTYRIAFEENEATNMFVCVDTVYGKYSFDRAQYKAYKIPGTDCYLEYIDTSENIFNAIVGLTKCLGMQLDEIQFHLRNKIYTDSRLNFSTLDTCEEIVDIDSLEDKIKPGIHMVSAIILGEVVNAHRLDVALLAICNKLYDEYGAFRLSVLPSNSSTGIRVLEDGDELNKNIVRIRDSEIGVYCDGDVNGIIQFIKESMTVLEIGRGQIEFKFRSLKDKNQLKDWEIE